MISPVSDRLINYYRIEKAIDYLTDNFQDQPDLDEIAAKVCMSPFHFQKIFTDWVGISPKKFIQYLTLDYLRSKIKETKNMMEAAELAGLSSQSRVHDLFVTIEGMSPQQYKAAGKDMIIFYAYHASPFGMCFIAITGTKVCALKFIDEEQSRDELQIFSRRWQSATIIHNPDLTKDFVKRIFNHHPDRENLRVLVKGTEFQIKVWEALVRIPFGTVATFRQAAEAIHQPNATRAVGSAVAANAVLYLIPCHRIITGDGTMGNYHFGKARKQTMIGWENARLDHPAAT